MGSTIVKPACQHDLAAAGRQGAADIERDVTLPRVVAVGPVSDVAVAGGDAGACGLHDVAAGLGQNGRARCRAGQAGVQIDIAAVNADGPVDRLRARDGNSSRVAWFSQGHSGQARANRQVRYGPGQRAGEAGAKGLHRQRAGAIGIERSVKAQCVGVDGDIAGGRGDKRACQIAQGVGVAVRRSQQAASTVAVQGDGAALGQHIGIAQTKV